MRKFKLSKLRTMIQRIQTVFLLLAVVALGLYLWFPLIGLENQNFKDVIKGWEVGHTVDISGQAYIIFFNAIFVGTAAGLSLINIFLFKNRSLQMLLCWFCLVLIVLAGSFVYYKYNTRVFIGYVLLTWWNVLAIAAALLQLLAFIYIRKDQETIRSLDRLR
ncbi:MAG: hypothetical protein JWO06_3436 [Bacteroidota bacterium]|nr:hypothetical protein [Bacteroidota bacterium]